MSQIVQVNCFVAKSTVVLAKYSTSSGNFSTITLQCLHKLPSNSTKHTHSCDGHTFNFIIDSGFAPHSGVEGSSSPPPMRKVFPPEQRNTVLPKAPGRTLK
ncbi:Vesicle-associated membrane protein [Thalictrum thalictroides]|uniref:Vesicle-associated membrane protein n=1 Tax=Thalictrum thalictroides TaxID=46969 RepID=A0A7J6UTR2_THATH|nr:Vesicle-associated membrane protein [Thalictrum thalictroides]